MEAPEFHGLTFVVATSNPARPFDFAQGRLWGTPISIIFLDLGHPPGHIRESHPTKSAKGGATSVGVFQSVKTKRWARPPETLRLRFVRLWSTPFSLSPPAQFRYAQGQLPRSSWGGYEFAG